MPGRHWTSFVRKLPAARRTFYGETFDSRGEMLRYMALLGMQHAGEIRALRRQVVFPIETPELGPLLSLKGRPMTWCADFVYERRQGAKWLTIVEDYKSYLDEETALRIAVVLWINGFRFEFSGPAGRPKRPKRPKRTTRK